MNVAYPYRFDATGHTAQADALTHIRDMIEAGLQHWLSDVIRVQSVDVTAVDATLTITIVYVVLHTQQQQTQEFVYGGAQA
jgi:hypothetical protein